MNELLKMTESELKEHIFNVQNIVKQKLDSGIDIDDFLDETTIFDDFENIIPDEEFPIFVIAILNDIRKKAVIDKIIDSILDIEPASKKHFSKSKKKAEQHPFC